MAPRNQRGRLQVYENIQVGVAVTSFEKTIAGSVPPIELGGTGASTVANGSCYSNVAVASAPPTTIINDDIQPAVTTLTMENVRVGG